MNLTRRRLLTAATGAAGLGTAAFLARRSGLIPPDYRSLYGIGATLTYASQRVLLANQPLAREFTRDRISKVFPVNGDLPQNPDYHAHLRDSFKDWRLNVDGLVAKPLDLSLSDIKSLPSRTQITLHACEEGWSFISEWTGVTVADVLVAAGIRPEAKFVAFFPFDESWDSLDMADALHPQTLLAYKMNGEDLPAPHGAPVRLRVARQLGYKSVKYLSSIIVTDSLKDFGKGLGSISPEWGYSWYAGI